MENLKNSEVLENGTEPVNEKNTESGNPEVKELSAAEKIKMRIADKKSGKEVENVSSTITEDFVRETKTETQLQTPTPEVEIVESNTANSQVKPENVLHEKHIEAIEDEDEPDEDFFDLSREGLVGRFRELVESEPVQRLKNRTKKIKEVFYKKLSEDIEKTKEEFLQTGGKIEEFKNNVEDKLEDSFKSLFELYREKRAEFTKKEDEVKQANLKKKLAIIEELKTLINKPEAFNHTFNEFKDLQKRWREIGSVPAAETKPLWDSYNYQVESFYNYIEINKELRDLDFKRNLEKKIQLCERAEELLIMPGIVKAYKELQTLHDKWRETGPVANDKKEEVWERFKSVTIKINKAHQDHFEGLKTEQEKNLKNKLILCEKVEELASDEITNIKDWKETGNMVVEIQKLWKGIGYAPKVNNDEVYKRFRNACDKFFNKKRDFFTSELSEKDENLQKKLNLCIEAESLQNSTDWKKTADIFKNLQEDWKKIGQISRKQSDELWKRFRKACNHFFETKQNHFQHKRTNEDDNLAKKQEVIEQILNFNFTDKGSEDLNKLKDLQNQWTEIGHVPFDKKDEVYHKFRDAVNQKLDELNMSGQQKTKAKYKDRLDSIKNSGKSKELFADDKEKIQSKIDKINADITLWENNLGYFSNTKNAESMINDFKEKIASSKETVKELSKQIAMLRKEEKDNTAS